MQQMEIFTTDFWLQPANVEYDEMFFAKYG